MEIRVAQDQDMVLLDAFCEAESLGTGWGHDALLAAHEALEDSLWLAVDESLLVGFLVARTVAAEAELLNIVISKDSRRQGLGRRLMAAWTEQVVREQVERIFLEVRVSNLAAIALYEEFGFERVGRRPKYYRPDLEDALVMSRGL